MHVTHINRLLVILSLLMAVMPVLAVSLLLHGTHVLAAAMMWYVY